LGRALSNLEAEDFVTCLQQFNADDFTPGARLDLSMGLEGRLKGFYNQAPVFGRYILSPPGVYVVRLTIVQVVE
jgi:hypothetical protein